ncbi:MAG: MgtC/SapB family protein [Patescibacteria group bacterium]|nr:MgtC/SapB family protein [Patescibacteria group bacterium]
MEFTVLLNFVTALALGALVGIERQRDQKTGGFAGVRTFTLISFLGALSAFIFKDFQYTLILPLVFGAVVVLVVSSYIVSAMKGYMGITAEVSSFVTFFLGFLVMFDQYKNYALVFAVLITILLSFKNVLHKFIEGAKVVEWNDTLKFALIAFVILPLLPEKLTLSVFHEPFEELNLIYPREAWLLVVFVGAISFVGYFLVKFMGSRKGTNMIGALGGIVSSTAVTQSMAAHSKSSVGNRLANQRPLITATILATIVSFIRIGVISVTINQDLYIILIPIAVLVTIGLVFFLIYSRDETGSGAKIKLESPLKLKPALILGFLYLLLTFVSKLSFALKLGKSGIIITSIITGFFDIDPVILTVSSLSVMGDISSTDAICAILLALASNQLTKSFIAFSTGSKQYGAKVARIFLIVLILILAFVLYLKSI